MVIERIRTACGGFLNDQSHTSPWRPVLQLAQDCRRANEVPRGTTVFSDDPGKTSFYGCRALIEIVAPQTHSRFQTQGVTGTETSKLNGRAEECRCKEGGMGWRDRNLLECQRSTKGAQDRELTSKPSSPVYPPRATCTLMPSSGTNALRPNVNARRS